jgi:hypothetical protein
MLPWLRDGDLIEIRPAPPAGVRIGDVLCYEPSPGRLTLHRVVARNGRGFLTRGDALAYVENVPAASVLGVVVAVERGGRVRRLDTPVARRWARVAAAVSPALARLLPGARALRRAWRAVRRG